MFTRVGWFTSQMAANIIRHVRKEGNKNVLQRVQGPFEKKTYFLFCGERTTTITHITVPASCWISDNIWNPGWKLQSSRAAVNSPHLGGREAFDGLVFFLSTDGFTGWASLAAR